MIDGFPRYLTVTAALGSAVVGGCLFVFSAFVMPGLRKLADQDGARAMQAINRAAPTSPAFLVAFVGTAVLCVGLGLYGVARIDQPYGRYLIAGSLLYLSAIALTAGYHIPRNDALDLVDPATTAGMEAWRSYVPGWVAWNHVRSATAIGGSLAFMLALIQEA